MTGYEWLRRIEHTFSILCWLYDTRSRELNSVRELFSSFLRAGLANLILFPEWTMTIVLKYIYMHFMCKRTDWSEMPTWNKQCLWTFASFPHFLTIFHNFSQFFFWIFLTIFHNIFYFFLNISLYFSQFFYNFSLFHAISLHTIQHSWAFITSKPSENSWIDSEK